MHIGHACPTTASLSSGKSLCKNLKSCNHPSRPFLEWLHEATIGAHCAICLSRPLSAVANRRASPTIQAERGHFISTRPHYEQDVPESISGGSKNFCGQNV